MSAQYNLKAEHIIGTNPIVTIDSCVVDRVETIGDEEWMILVSETDRNYVFARILLTDKIGASADMYRDDNDDVRIQI